MEAIELAGLTKRYGSRVGVEELTLAVPGGAMYGFLGPNGSGKTTTIRVLLGLLRPTSGAARVFGLDCWGDSAAIKADIGYLPGDLRMPGWLSCGEALRLFGRIRKRDLNTRGLELAEAFGLDPALRVNKMSRGTRQKLGLVLALAHDPRLLILDEPTASLDPLMQQLLYARLRSAVANGGTVLFSSHTLAEVEDLCSHVSILRQSRLVASDSLEVLRSRVQRRVSIRWRTEEDASRAAPIDCIDWTDRNGLSWNGLVRGTVADALRWMAAQPLADGSLERPDLTEIFQRFYV